MGAEIKLPVLIRGYDAWRLAGPPEPDELTEAERAELDDEAADRGDYLLERDRDTEDSQPCLRLHVHFQPSLNRDSI